MSDPNEIWLSPDCHGQGDGREWCRDDVWGACEEPGCGCKPVRYVLAADYDALLARAEAAEADFLATVECDVEQRKTIQRFQTELATERLRADAAVGDANAAERRVAELEGLLREAVTVFRTNDLLLTANYLTAALAGQPQQGEPEWPKEQCPVTGAIRDVDPADLGDQQQGERCQGENCGTTTGQHSRECIEEAARDQGWIPTEEDFKGYAKPEQPATADERKEVSDAELLGFAVDEEFLLFCDEDEFVQIARSVLEKFGQARAVLAQDVVVMPARMTTIPEGKTISYAAGYEAALDAVASLNRNTVPLELLRVVCSGGPEVWQALEELRAILAGDKS